jgi:hypothetical protein
MGNLADRSTNSLYFEKLIEHRFISDIMAYCWYKKNETLEIIHAEIDNNGYDLLLCYKNIDRYIQLKTSEEKSTTSQQNINLSIISKKNPCIVWIVRKFDLNKNDFVFKYLFWGSKIGEPLPNVEKLKTSKRTTANSKGVKKERENFRIITKKDFIEFSNIEKLFEQLFSKKNNSFEANISIGYNMYTVPNSVNDISELRKITKEHLNGFILRKNEKDDMEKLCNMDKKDLVGKWFDKNGNIYYGDEKQVYQFTLCINYLKKIFK